MSENKYYVNITKEEITDYDSVSISLDGDNDKVSIVSSDEFDDMNTTLESISSDVDDWLTNTAETKIEAILTDDLVIPYSTSSGGLLDTSTDETISFSAIKETVEGFNSLVDLVYPVGSIYMSVNDVSPSTLFGGTWEKLENSFLLGSGTYSLGITGGEVTHTLTLNEMPTHTHSQKAHTHTQDSHTHTQASHYHDPAITNEYFVTHEEQNAINRNIADTGNELWVDGQETKGFHHRWYTSTVTPKINSATATNQETVATNYATGGSRPHNNMPPYLVVNMWKRTS